MLFSCFPSGSSHPSSLPAYELRTFVLDYLVHHCYTKTAKAFIKDSTVPCLDADGDEIQLIDSPDGRCTEHFEEILKKGEIRANIRAHILAGRAEEATRMLEKSFPTVLAKTIPRGDVAASRDEHIISRSDYASPTSVDPSHLSLNLRIFSFTEACRTVPLEYPKQSLRSQHTEALDSRHAPVSKTTQDRKLILLSMAQQLLDSANLLPKNGDREVYCKELSNVSALLAYKNPETSPVAQYLSQERRGAVADQIDRAILHRSGLPIVSSLELMIRQIMSVWSLAHHKGVKPQPGVMLPPVPPQQASGKYSEIVPTLDLQYLLSMQT